MAKVNSQKRKCRYLPRRPKRPLTGWNLFFRHFYFSVQCRSADRWKNRMEIMKQAAKAWKCSPPKTRRIYNATAARTVVKYRQEMTRWNSMKNLLRKPANAYQLFFHDFARDANGMIPFIQLGHSAGRRWKALDTDTKQTYFERSHMNYRRYSTIHEALEGGANIEDFLPPLDQMDLN